MKAPLKVGDRCAVYSRSRFSGRVEAISPAGGVHVIEDGFYSVHDDGPFHPKQCRRLRKKERRQIIVLLHDCKNRVQAVYDKMEWAEQAASEYRKDGYYAEIVEFIEVRRK